MHPTADAACRSVTQCVAACCSVSPYDPLYAPLRHCNCNILQHTATFAHCNTQCRATTLSMHPTAVADRGTTSPPHLVQILKVNSLLSLPLRISVQLTFENIRDAFSRHPSHTATHCNTLQHILETHPFTALQHTATYCNTLQHTATRCNTFSRQNLAATSGTNSE